MRAREGLHLEGAVYYVRSSGRLLRFVALQPALLAAPPVRDVVAVGRPEQRLAALAALLAAGQAVAGLGLAVGLAQGAGAFGQRLDGLLAALALAVGGVALDGLREAALDELPADVELDLLQLAHEVLAVEALPRQRHKIY